MCIRDRRQFAVNFFGAASVVRHALPHLRASRGAVVNVSSAAAVFAIPFQAYYSASKAALNALTLALRSEVGRFGVRVSAVMPGDVKTGFTAARRHVHAGDAVYGEAVARSVARMERDETNGMPPEAVARAIVRQAQKRRPKPVKVVGVSYQCMAAVQKLLPVRLVNALVGKIYGGR